MDLLLILTYTALCVAVFKIFRIPLNKWTVPTAALGGIIIIGALIILMNYNHPYSEMARNYYISTPIVPLVKGRVVEVPVKPNQLVKKGDVLFRLDDEPFRLKADSLAARVESNREHLKSIEARLRSAKLDRDLVSERRDDFILPRKAEVAYDLLGLDFVEIMVAAQQNQGESRRVVFRQVANDRDGLYHAFDW